MVDENQVNGKKYLGLVQYTTEEALEYHQNNGPGNGKIEVVATTALKDAKDLSLAYTPGVAEPCKLIHEDPLKAYDYTAKGNMVAVVSDGTAVLGLGDIGPEAAVPVMEGKAILFKELAGVDAFPICLRTKDTEEIIAAVKQLEPVFGGINLEDISAPRCFEIEERLKKELSIPVFHDDQHGTAVVTTAGFINALKVVGKDLGDIKVVVNGAGAAGIACSKMLINLGVKDIILCDSTGIICPGRENGMNGSKEKIACISNKECLNGCLADAMEGADFFLGLSKGNLVTEEMVKTMNDDPIIFACANPTPEIHPKKALDAGARIVATGRSDFPNQINNVLGFPGIFRGALHVRATEITENMKLAAAKAIASAIPDEELSEINTIPSPFDPSVIYIEAAEVASQAIKDGVARIKNDPEELRKLRRGS